MANFSIALDEDVRHDLAGLLRSRGWDADSARELGRLGMSDTRVLLAAAQNRQTLVTHNRLDFLALHEAWATWRQVWESEVEQITGRFVSFSQHAGILITPHLPNRDLARILEDLADTAGPLEDRLFVWNRFQLWYEVHF